MRKLLQEITCHHSKKVEFFFLAGQKKINLEKIFENYGYSRPEAWNFYERFMKGEMSPNDTGWVEPSDYEQQPLD